MEDAKCILCGHNAERGSFTEAEPNEHGRTNVAGGFKYDCPECGFYALDGYEHNWVTRFASDKQNEILSDWVKRNPDKEGLAVVLRWPKIKKILRLP